VVVVIYLCPAKRMERTEHRFDARSPQVVRPEEALPMFDTSWRSRLDRLSRVIEGTGRRPPKPSRRYRPVLEPLEDRTVLSTVFVNVANMADPHQDGSAAHPFGTIQQGVNAAGPYDIVSVAAGTYAESVNVNKSVHLNGSPSNPTGVVIAPPAGQDGIDITAIDVTVADLRVAPSAGGGRNGITATGVNQVALSDVDLENNPGLGFQATNLATLTLVDVTLLGNAQGGGAISGIPSIQFGHDAVTLTPTYFQETRGSQVEQAVTYANESVLSVSGAASFLVTPSPDTKFQVNGGNLALDLAGVTNPVVTPQSIWGGHPIVVLWPVPGMGQWTFGNREHVTYSGVVHMTPGMRISGQVFADLNVNGVRNRGEPALAGALILLSSPYGQPYETTVTDAAGNYSFTGLVPSVYQVSVLHAPGWTETLPAWLAYPPGLRCGCGIVSPPVPRGAYHVGPVAGPPSALAVPGQDFGVITNANRGFVYAAHLDLMRQRLGLRSLAAWQAKLARHQVSRAAVALAFIDTNQCRAWTAYGLYQVYLRRSPTRRELAVLAGLLQGTGGPERAAARLLGSREFFQAVGAPAPPPSWLVAYWLSDAYSAASGLWIPPGDVQSGLPSYLRLLAHGATRESVALRMLYSPAGQTALVQNWSHQYLQRPATMAEQTRYLRLLRSGWSEDQVLAQIIGSPAYLAHL
jgi:hypothetical protein